MGLNDGSGFQPLVFKCSLTWGVAPGCYGFGPLALPWANWKYRSVSNNENSLDAR